MQVVCQNAVGDQVGSLGPIDSKSSKFSTQKLLLASNGRATTSCAVGRKNSGVLDLSRAVSDPANVICGIESVSAVVVARALADSSRLPWIPPPFAWWFGPTKGAALSPSRRAAFLAACIAGPMQNSITAAAKSPQERRWLDRGAVRRPSNQSASIQSSLRPECLVTVVASQECSSLNIRRGALDRLSDPASVQAIRKDAFTASPCRKEPRGSSRIPPPSSRASDTKWKVPARQNHASNSMLRSLSFGSCWEREVHSGWFSSSWRANGRLFEPLRQECRCPAPLGIRWRGIGLRQPAEARHPSSCGNFLMAAVGGQPPRSNDPRRQPGKVRSNRNRRREPVSRLAFALR